VLGIKPIALAMLSKLPQSYTSSPSTLISLHKEAESSSSNNRKPVWELLAFILEALDRKNGKNGFYASVQMRKGKEKET
jgi:hypothetical protein